MLTINSTNSNKCNVNFGMYLHTVRNNVGRLIYRGDTSIFRNDLDWTKVCQFILDKYKDAPDVQIIVHACSDGEEVYTLVSKLLTMETEENLKKYFPIIARDIDKEHIALAKKGVFEMESFEESGAKFYLKNKLYKFFNPLKIGKSTTIQATDILKNKVQFEVSDILEDVDKLHFRNKILFARNFMPYLSLENKAKLIDKLAKRFDSTSTLIIGDYDKEYGVDRILRQWGFRESSIENVFEKPKDIPSIYTTEDYIPNLNIYG